jgi:hypothetical protein
VINGSKTFISNGTHCDLLVIVAKADPAKGAAGISLIVADTNDRPKGFERVHHASWGRRVADVELLRRHTRGCDHDFVHPILPHWLAECGSLMLGFFLPGMTTRTHLNPGASSETHCKGCLRISVCRVAIWPKETSALFVSAPASFRLQRHVFIRSSFELLDGSFHQVVGVRYVEVPPSWSQSNQSEGQGRCRGSERRLFAAPLRLLQLPAHKVERRSQGWVVRVDPSARIASRSSSSMRAWTPLKHNRFR